MSNKPKMPEPVKEDSDALTVAYTAMPPVSVIVENDYELRWVGAEPIAKLVERTGAKPGSVFITTDQAEAYADARVRAALEEAAEIADRMNAFPVYDAIRALIPKEDI